MSYERTEKHHDNNEITENKEKRKAFRITILKGNIDIIQIMLNTNKIDINSIYYVFKKIFIGNKMITNFNQTKLALFLEVEKKN